MERKCSIHPPTNHTLFCQISKSNLLFLIQVGFVKNIVENHKNVNGYAWSILSFPLGLVYSIPISLSVLIKFWAHIF